MRALLKDVEALGLQTRIESDHVTDMDSIPKTNENTHRKVMNCGGRVKGSICPQLWRRFPTTTLGYGC